MKLFLFIKCSNLKVKRALAGMLIFCQALLFSQETSFPKYKFETLKNSTTQRAVSSISQDEQGFIWMGTNGLGLNKYNGIDYISYQFNGSDSTSISNSLIHTTFVDSKNNLWIGTQVGLDLYNRDLDNFKHIELVPENGYKTIISVHAIMEAKDGSIIIGTHQKGLFRIDPKTFKATTIPIRGVENVGYLLINALADFDNRILIGSNKGVMELEHVSNEYAHPISFKTQSGEPEISSSIETMQVDSKGSVWIGTTQDGIIKIDGNENGRYQLETIKITEKRIMSLSETPRNTILCGTENAGMFEMNRKGIVINHYLNQNFEEGDLKSNSIWDLFLDNKNRIWVSYYNNGIGLYDAFYDKFLDIESKSNYVNSLQANSVTAISEDDQGRLWIGMDGGGVDVYDMNLKTFTHLLDSNNPIAKGLDASDVQTVYKDSKGNMWVGTWNFGIYFLQKGSRQFINYSMDNTNGALETNRILSFSEDADGILWIGTFSSGLYSFDPISKNITSYSNTPFIVNKIAYSDVRTVYVDSEDTIWIGGNAGLFRLTKTKNDLKIESLTQRLRKGQQRDQQYTGLVLQIYEDSKKNIWIGTDGTGLFKYDMRKDSFTWVNAEGFNKVTVSSIIEDEVGNLWVAGNNGISKINQLTGTVSNFSINDGLLTNDFNNNAAYKSEKGALFFGSYEGINYFDPNELPLNSNTSDVYLSDLKLFNKSVVPGQKNTPLTKVLSQTEQITLNHEQSVFTIDYAPIDFTRPEEISYAYYLDGFENDWNYVQSTRNATYTNLPAGDYTFKVKAANSDGVWNTNFAALDITILRPWWGTNWAILLYILITLTLAYVIFQFLDARLKSKRLILQEREKYLQEEVLNTKKIQFFTNISHEFRTPLTLILSPLEDILNEHSLPENIKKKHGIIHKNANRLKRLIDELMDFRKLQFNEIPLVITLFDVVVLVDDIMGHYYEEAQQRNIALSLEKEFDCIHVSADRNKLEKIIFNILSNAFKSTPTNGIITITLSVKEAYHFKLIQNGRPIDALELTIEDTGKGIDPGELTKIFDRFYQIKELDQQYFGGTGIGLEVVRSFVDLHQGEIEVESEIGVGTKFKVLIPMINTQQDIMDKSTLEIAEAELIQPSEKVAQINVDKILNEAQELKKTVLIVEDNIELSIYIKEELKKDFKIVLAENGQMGLEAAFKSIPDVIITDILMPVMNGIEFCQKIKKDLRTSHIPVLMLTAKATADDWVDGLESGADVYMNKPFDMKVIKSYINQLISNRTLLFSKYLGEEYNELLESDVSSLDQQFILNIIGHINKNISEPNLNVEKLAIDFYLSRSQLYRKIKALTGISANELIRKIRLEKAKELIENTDHSIGVICDFVGFSSPSYFSKCFKERFGVLPTDLKSE